MIKTTGYVYNSETNVLVARVTGDYETVVEYVVDNYDADECALTFSPGFGLVDGLIDSADAEDIEIVCKLI